MRDLWDAKFARPWLSVMQIVIPNSDHDFKLPKHNMYRCVVCFSPYELFGNKWKFSAKLRPFV